MLSPRNRRSAALHATLVVSGAIVIVPVVWIALAAFKTQIALLRGDLLFTPWFGNFDELLFSRSADYGAHFVNSLVIASVSTALVALKRENVDVLIADLGMPIEDGYDLIRHVRSSELEKIARLPAAALTAYTTEEDRDRVLAAGFQFHLAKPVDPAVLVATVERLRGETLSVH